MGTARASVVGSGASCPACTCSVSNLGFLSSSLYHIVYIVFIWIYPKKGGLFNCGLVSILLLKPGFHPACFFARSASVMMSTTLLTASLICFQMSNVTQAVLRGHRLGSSSMHATGTRLPSMARRNHAGRIFLGGHGEPVSAPVRLVRS